MLVSGGLLFMCAFPALQIPNFKTAAATDQSDLAFQSNFLAKLFRQNETALSIRRAVLRARMQVTQKNPAIARGDSRVRLRRGTHAGKLFRRHDHEKLIRRFRKNDELPGTIVSPARGYGDAIFLVDGMTEFAGEELRRRWRVHMR